MKRVRFLNSTHSSKISVNLGGGIASVASTESTSISKQVIVVVGGASFDIGNRDV